MAKISKILYLVTQSEWGGAQRYIFDLAKNLPQDQYIVTVVAGGAGELHTKFDETRVSTVTVKNLVREINPIKDLLAYFELKKLFKQQKPDIVHLNSSKAGTIGAIAAKHAGVKKIIYTVHGFVFNEPLPAWKKQFYLFSEKISEKYKDKLICVSNFDKQTGTKNKIAKENKFITIHNGIEKINFIDKQNARNELNLPQDKIIVGTVANFYATKGLQYFVAAARLVADKLPSVIFRMVGDGELKSEIKLQIKKLDLEDKFILGTKPEAYKYLKAFDIFVLPSAKEGLPYTIIEAMQAGLPIISTNVGGIPEMINTENGILVEPRNPQALAENIIKLIENKNLANHLGNQAKIDAENKFNLNKMIGETEKVYLE